MASTLLPVGSDAETDARKAVVGENRPAETIRIAVMTPATQPPERASQPAVAKPQPAAYRAAPSVPAPSPVIVTLTHRMEPAPPAAPQKAAHLPPDRASLARDLQLELKRAGCYSGEINGVWTPATRKAMKAFTDRVNATLPIDDPDHILLSLVRAHQGEACSKPCPAGQGLADDGRCLPSAILTHAPKRAAPPAATAAPRRGGEPAERPVPAIAGWTTTTAVAPAGPANPSAAPPIGRMALAGPSIDVPPTATEPPPRAGEATGDRNKRAGTAHRARERRPERVVRTYATRSNFVQSILYDRRSIN